MDLDLEFVLFIAFVCTAPWAAVWLVGQIFDLLGAVL
jgi:hypothetical protein